MIYHMYRGMPKTIKIEKLNLPQLQPNNFLRFSVQLGSRKLVVFLLARWKRSPKNNKIFKKRNGLIKDSTKKKAQNRTTELILAYFNQSNSSIEIRHQTEISIEFLVYPHGLINRTMHTPNHICHYDICKLQKYFFFLSLMFG